MLKHISRLLNFWGLFSVWFACVKFNMSLSRYQFHDQYLNSYFILATRHIMWNAFLSSKHIKESCWANWLEAVGTHVIRGTVCRRLSSPTSIIVSRDMQEMLGDFTQLLFVWLNILILKAFQDISWKISLCLQNSWEECKGRSENSGAYGEKDTSCALPEKQHNFQ